MATLENAALSVELDPKTGGLRSIFDRRLKREYIGKSARALLCRVMTPEGLRQRDHVDATGARIDVEENTATVKYALPHLEATATLTLEEDALHARIRLTNTGPRVIEEIMFPLVRGVAPLDGAALVWPSVKQRRVTPFNGDLGGDHRTWNGATQKMVARYPEGLASAWCDYGDGTGGLALEGRHRDFSIMDFFVEKVLDKTAEPVQRSLDLTLVHPRRVAPGESWESPEIRLSVHSGDWHVAADAHRAWLEEWIKKPKRPKKFAESIGWHFFFMKHQDGQERNSYADLPAMAEAALSAACPYLLVFGWQKGGHDNHYLYRYVPNEDWGGMQALRGALGEVRRKGVEAIPLFNGTLADPLLLEHARFGSRWEAHTRTGHPYYAGDWTRHNIDAPSRNRARLHHEVAPCEELRAYVRDTLYRIVKTYGFGNVELDQIAEKMLVDYNEGHVETTPDRVYVDGLAALLPELRATVREANPEGVVLSESLNEFAGQWCDASWDWTSLLPFPEPILYTLPWLFSSCEIDALEYGEVNRAFAYKMYLDLKIDGGDAPISKYPEFAAHVRALAELRRRVAPYYVYADFRDEEGLSIRTDGGLVAKVFANRAAGKVGIVLCECSGEPAEVTLACQWDAALNVFHFDSSTGDTGALPYGSDVTLKLGAYEVAVLCVDLAEENPHK